jgi:hypothetical protein
MFEYRYVEGTRTRNGRLYVYVRLISRMKAKKVIENRGLVRAFSDGSGTIYDTEDQAFKALFPEGVKTIDDIYQIEKVDRV